MPVLIAKRETTGKGPEMTHTAIKPKTRVQTKGKSITAHMTNDDYDLATLAADCCELTSSQFGAAAISDVSKLVLMRAEHGWRRYVMREWWRIIKEIAL